MAWYVLPYKNNNLEFLAIKKELQSRIRHYHYQIVPYQDAISNIAGIIK